MNLPNKKKLLNSKWTATNPERKEKHFTVTQVKLNEDDPQIVEFIVLTAVINSKNYKIDYKELTNHLNWIQGWK